MGKSKGDSVRSKTRPSSSSLAASLVQTSRVSLGFGGYVGNAKLEEAISSERDAFLDLDSEVIAHLRRLSKKDSVTKLKALAALNLFFEEHNSDEVGPVLPHWIFEYKRLVYDNNRQVRETANKTMMSILVKAGRSLAPHLKSLIGPWWMSQFDLSAEVSEAAKQSFQIIFRSQRKRFEALLFCMTELFNYLSENLKLTAQTIADKGASVEESTEKYERAISSSLLSLAALLHALSAGPGAAEPSTENKGNTKNEVEPMLTTAVMKLCQDHKHLEVFVKSKSSYIRSAAYQALRAFVQYVPQAFEPDSMDDVVKLVLGAFGEKEPLCHQAMWDMILCFTRQFSNAWEANRLRKVAFPRLWAFLRHGCYGSQQISYPCLLPFLSLISPHAIIPAEDFFYEFFGSLWKGHEECSRTVADGHALLKGVQECFIWVVANAKRYCDVENAGLSNFRQSLVNAVLLKLMWTTYINSNPLKVPKIEAQREKEYNQSDSKGERIKIAEAAVPTFRHELGIYITDILKSLGTIDTSFLDCFWSACHKVGVIILDQAAAHAAEFDDQISHLSQFLDLVIARYASVEEKDYIITVFLQPFIVEIFPIVQSSGSSKAIKLLAQLVSAFGPTAFRLVKVEDKQDSGIGVAHVFRTVLLPWCLEWDAGVIDSKLELLLSFLCDVDFYMEWNFVLHMLASQMKSEANVVKYSLNLEKVEVLALLLEKMQRKGLCEGTQQWQSDALDKMVLDICQCDDLFKMPCCELLRTVLGGSTEKKNAPLILSNNATIKILAALLGILISTLEMSNDQWVTFATSLLRSSIPGGSLEPTGAQLPTSLFDSAISVMQVLKDCFPSLYFLDNDSQILTKLGAALIFLYWAYGADAASGGADSHFTEFVNNMSQVVFPDFKRLNAISRHNLRWHLLECIRNAVFGGSDIKSLDPAGTFTKWVVDLVSWTCINAEETDEAIDTFLAAKDCSWPLWVQTPPTSKNMLPAFDMENIIETAEHRHFVQLVDAVGSRLGYETLILGSTPTAAEHALEVNGMTSDHKTGRSMRPWLILELLCTWDWDSGSASRSVLPFLRDCAAYKKESSQQSVVTIVLDCLFSEASRSRKLKSVNEDFNDAEPFLRALLHVLKVLFENEGAYTREEAEALLYRYIAKQGDAIATICPLHVLPKVLGILMPVLRRKVSETEANLFKPVICHWLNLGLLSTPIEMINWVEVAVACFPLNPCGGAAAVLAASSAAVSEREQELLLLLGRKACGKEPQSWELNEEVLIAKLLAATVAYCWKVFAEQDWTLIINQLNKWLAKAVLSFEDMTESVCGIVETELHSGESSSMDHASERIWEEIMKIDDNLIWISSVAVNIYSLLKAIHSFEESSSTTTFIRMGEKWQRIDDRASESILRLLLTTGLVESSIIDLHDNEARDMISLNRVQQSQFWDLVADAALGTSSRAREAAIRAADLWGLGWTSISALYALLFTPHPIPTLQWVAYSFLSTEPLQQIAVTWGLEKASVKEENELEEYNVQVSVDKKSSSSVIAKIRPELAKVLEMPASVVLESCLSSSPRLHYFLAWSLFLSHLQSLMTLSQARERLVQYMQDSETTATLLDCLFQHIPLNHTSVQSISRKKNMIMIEQSDAAESAKRAASIGALSFAVEGLCNAGEKELTVVAGAIYGLLLRVLPASVRVWFTGLRDRSAAADIKAFTSQYCSPQLLADEFSQVQAAGISEEYLHIRANRSSREITASYKKEEAAMDILIRLPACYPLKAVEVDCTRRMGISETLLRKWILSMAAFLHNQNGAIAEAVQMWKQNVDREFEGVEECPICYSIIHTVNHALPRLPCKTCKHKFHAACLYKWFSTSHKSTCPLCQTPF